MLKHISAHAVLLIGALGSVSPLSLAAQTLVQPLPDPNSPVERLGRYIRQLAASPRDFDALLGAGQSALDVGDANAALGFFARAEEVSPSNGRVKAGIGSSLVMIERPDDALRLFAEAVALGVPEYAVARDRGLAYDLRGDNRRAQRDYVLAETRGRDDELTRRHALSLGISGDRAGALAMLDPLLRQQDQGAWRARAFVLAMSGDVAGANGVARQLMVPAMANAMAPLLSRLAALNPAERAHAVNFGTVPSDGTRLAVQAGDPYLGSATLRPSAPLPTLSAAQTGQALIPAGEPLGPRAAPTPSAAPTPRTQVARVDARPIARPGVNASPLTRGSGARPGFTAAAPLTPRPDAPVPAATVAPIASAPKLVSPQSQTPPPIRAPTQTQTPTPPPMQTQAPTPTPKPVPIEVATLPPSAAVPVQPPVQPFGPPVAANDAPAEQRQVVQTEEKPSSAVETQPVPTSPAAMATASRLTGLLAGIEPEAEAAVELPNARELRAARAAARKKVAELAAQAAADEAEKREKAEQAALVRKHPARIWVQVATGRNDSGIAPTLRRIRADNEKAIGSLGGWAAPYKATNRILVGPLKSAAAARDLVGKLGKNGVSATTWTSDAGEEVTKILSK